MKKRAVKVVRRDPMAYALALKQYQAQRTPTKRATLNKIEVQQRQREKDFQ